MRSVRLKIPMVNLFQLTTSRRIFLGETRSYSGAWNEGVFHWYMGAYTSPGLYFLVNSIYLQNGFDLAVSQ